MTYRGYLKDVDGSKRMRFVMPGYDADDEDVPPNKVIFDSNNIGTLSALYAGSYAFTLSMNDNTEYQLASWDLGFVPLCDFSFLWPDFITRQERVGAQFVVRSQVPTGQNLENNTIRVANDGLYMKCRGIPPQGTVVNWVAYNLAVA